MSANRDERVREVFGEVAALAAHERAGFLDQASLDPALRAEIESLLASHDSAAAFLSTPAMESTLLVGPRPGAGPMSDPLVGTVLGRYRITSVLGAGGMGVVYRAEQENPRRTVALKVVRSVLAGPDLLRRFRLESEVLGRLKHPGIAQIFEAGAAPGPDGRSLPFFAMELVQGVPLADFAAGVGGVGGAGLGTRERLELLARICDAVHHAHQKGVIHRDLKPANILVETEAAEERSAVSTRHGGADRTTTWSPRDPSASIVSAQPKILDFGVARLTDSDAAATMQTDAGQVIGTLAYMSPEQVRGQTRELDTRSDVYALGVILYELLTGELPHAVKGKTIPEAVRIISDDDPTIPASHSRALRGDVQTIILKALSKEPERRYQSAAELAADLRRHLADMPIVARPPSAAYHVHKLVRRHRVASALLVLLFLSSIAFGVAMFVLYRDADTQRVLASQAGAREAEAAAAARRDAETLAAANMFMQRMFGLTHPGAAPGPVQSVDEMLHRTAASIGGSTRGRPELEATLLANFGDALSARGDTDAALPLLLRAVELSKQLHGEVSSETALATKQLADLHQDRGEIKAAAALSVVALRIQRKLTPGIDGHMAAVMQSVASLAWQAGDLESAEGIYTELLSLAPKLAGSQNIESACLNNLAGLYAERRQYAKAEAMTRRAIDLIEGRRRSFGSDCDSIRSNLAWAIMMQGRAAEAEPIARLALENKVRDYPAGHVKIASSQSTLGQVLTALRRFDEAEALLRSALTTFDGKLAANSGKSVDARVALAECLIAAGKLDDAGIPVQEALAAVEQSGDLSPSTVSSVYTAAAALAHARQRPDQAAEYERRAREADPAGVGP